MGLLLQRRPVRGQYASTMTYVIGAACADVMDKSCVQECPVDCVYEGARSLYINPNECVDCGACKSICRMDAIYYESDLPADQQQHLADNAAFFRETLPGRDAPFGRLVALRTSGRLGSTHRWLPRCPATAPV
jgi:NAD-dependent dihydropyrimidine dehydrogenase PreA subunit